VAITTAAEYKTYAGITDATNDTYIGTLVTTAQDLAEDYIGYALDGASRTEFYDGAGSNVIILRGPPVVAITSIAPVAADGTVGTAWASTDFKVDLASGELRLTPETTGRLVRDDFAAINPEPVGQFTVQPSFADQFQNIKVVYTAGWGASPYTTAPSRLKFALWNIVDAIYLNATIATGGSSNEKVDVMKVVAQVMRPFARLDP
jgi:hypothetical protein